MLSRSFLRTVAGTSPELHPPIFLAPLLASIPRPLLQRSSFSTTAILSAGAKRKRNGNPHRGESALRRKTSKHTIGTSWELPQPVLDPKKRSKIDVDANHGLWGFFNKSRKALSTPKEDSERGTLRCPSAIEPTDRCRPALDC